MAVIIEPYRKDREKSVADFNRRLKAGGERFQFPESSIPHWLPPREDRKIFQEYFLAVEDEGEVRGGYILKHQEFSVIGETEAIGNYQLPLSEGTINTSYNALGLRLLNDALKRNPQLYALGMGGMHRPLPKLLAAMGWQLALVPFYFRVLRPYSFLRNIQYLRQSAWRRLLLDLLALSGLGWLGIKLFLVGRRGSSKIHLRGQAEEFKEFGPWATDLWIEVQKSYRLAAVRDAATLNILYPSADKKFIKLKVTEEGQIIGWAVLLDTRMDNHKQFGNMRVGTIVDCLSLTGREIQVIDAATGYLGHRGVDMIISNQTYRPFGEALVSSGFRKGPSNFALAVSPRLAKRVGPVGEWLGEYHFNRGDGDGPIHL